MVKMDYIINQRVTSDIANNNDSTSLIQAEIYSKWPCMFYLYRHMSGLYCDDINVCHHLFSNKMSKIKEEKSIGLSQYFVMVFHFSLLFVSRS